MDCSPPDSSVHGIFQARVLEWGAIAFSNIYSRLMVLLYLKVALVAKNLPTNTGDSREAGLIPRLGRSPGVGNGNSLQYFCLGNPMDRAAWGLQFTEMQRVRHD